MILFQGIISVNAQEQIDKIEILILYSSTEDRNSITEIFQTYSLVDLSVDTVTFENIETVSFDNYDFLILSSAEDFSMSGAQENRISEYTNLHSKKLMVFTPYLDEFGGKFRETLGIRETEDAVPDGSSTVDWQIQLQVDVGGYSKNSTFEYHGKIADFELDGEHEIIATVNSNDTSDEEIEKLDLPLPIIINSTRNLSQILVAGISPFDVSSQSGLGLNQVPFPLPSLLEIIITVSLDSFAMNILGVISDNPQTDSESDDSISELITNVDVDPRFLVILILVLFVLLFSKLLGVLRWLSERLWFSVIFIFGAFYNVQERIIDHNDVLLNQTRYDIMDFLDHVKGNGAHLREIKGILKLGTGSLLWHLQVLEDFNWISKYKIGQYTVFVSTDFEDNFSTSLKEAELQLSSKNSSLMLEQLAGYEPRSEISLQDLLKHEDVNRKALSRFIKKLDLLEIIQIINDRPISFEIIDQTKLRKVNQSLINRSTYEQSKSDVKIMY